MAENVMIYKMNVENSILNIHKDFTAINTVSLEGFGDIIEGISNMFAKRFNVITNAFGGKNEETFSTTMSDTISDYAKQLRMKEYIVENIIRNKPVSVVLDTEVIVPLGFKSDYLTAAKELDKALNLIEKSVFKELDSVDTYLSLLLSNVDQRTSSRPIKKDNSKKELNKVLGKYLTSLVATSGQNEIRPVRTLLPNVNKLREVHSIFINVSNITSLDNLKKISDLTTNMRSKCEELYNISNNNPGFKIKKEILVNLVNELEEAALLVTNSTAIISFYVQLVNTYMLALEKINQR